MSFTKSVSSIDLVASNYAYRCDVKIADVIFLEYEAKVRAGNFYLLGDLLPCPFVKGVQPEYLDQFGDDTVPVVNTLSIQNLELKLSDCRHISVKAFDDLPEQKKLKNGDVLLTMDGGVSIGKPLYFALDDDMTMDSHVVAIRGSRVSQIGLAYLLASPICQMQFRRAESGASGQTAVTEDDIRRFIVPAKFVDDIDSISKEIEIKRQEIRAKRADLDVSEAEIWRLLDV